MLAKRLKRDYTKSFISLKRRDSKFGIAAFIGYFSQIIGLIILGIYLVNLGNEYLFPLILLVSFLIATRFRAFNNIIHECMHYSYCDEKKTNIILGKLAASLIFTNYADYKKEHISHHQNLGDFEKDLDFHHRSKFGFDQKLTGRVIFRHFITPIFMMHYPQYFNFAITSKDGEIYAAIKWMIVVVSLAFAIVNPISFFLFIIVPFFWLYTALNYWTDCVDHGGIINEKDDLHQSRNLIINKFSRSILFPRNDCYHLIHHLFPSVPSHHMERVHEMLMMDHRYSDLHKKQAILAPEFVGGEL